ncbi:MAG: chemotaxis protein CheW [Pseudomonadota bacterium]
MSTSPFDTLKAYEKRSLVHAVGLPEQALASGTWSGIAFSVADLNLVGDISEIVEILPVPAMTIVPGAKPWIMGVANVRGTLVPVVDFRVFLGGERVAHTNTTRVLVIQQSGGVVGLLIDEVQGQRHFLKEERTEDSHYEGQAIEPYLVRQYVKGDDHWGAVDFTRLVNNPVFMQAAA